MHRFTSMQVLTAASFTYLQLSNFTVGLSSIALEARECLKKRDSEFYKVTGVHRTANPTNLAALDAG